MGLISPNSQLFCCHLLLVCFLINSIHGIEARNNNEQTPEMPGSQVMDESKELSEEELSLAISDFSKHVKEMMSEKLDKLIDEVEEKKSKATDDEALKRFKVANEQLTNDTQARIELAGQINKGETTQWSGIEATKSFLSQVGNKLQTAGDYIGNQMNSLSALAPKIKGKMRSVPGKLRKLMRWPAFLRFKIKFNKSYKSLREELFRQMIYLRTQTMTGIHNLKFLLGRRTYLLKATQFADILPAEYKKWYNNAEAETKDNSADIPKVDEASSVKLRELAAKEQNIFGQSMSEIIEKTEEKSQKSHEKNRSKRWANDELSQSEDEDMIDAMDTDDDDDTIMNELDSTESDDDDDEGGSVVIDQFIADFDDDADIDELDDVEKIVDEVLDDKKEEEVKKDDFKPIDLRETGCILKPQNQWSCGCCYAHVNMVQASYFNCMLDQKEKKTERYNVRFLSDCGRYLTAEGEPPLIRGCAGGRISLAFQFVKRAGVFPFFTYEAARAGKPDHLFDSDVCVYDRPQSIDNWAPVQVPTLKNLRFVNLKYDQVDLHLRTVGPVYVNVRTWSNFEHIGAGIYEDFEENEKPVIHSMLIVGHNRDPNGRDYWIIWNSHGTSWGEMGYTRIYDETLRKFTVYMGGLIQEVAE